MGIKKLCWFWSVEEVDWHISIKQKCDTFSLSLMIVKFVFLKTFFVNFLTLFFGFEISTKYWILKKSFLIYIFLVISALFVNFEATQRAGNRLKNINIFCKFVLKFYFAPIIGPVFLISITESNSLYPSGHAVFYLYERLSLRKSTCHLRCEKINQMIFALLSRRCYLKGPFCTASCQANLPQFLSRWKFCGTQCCQVAVATAK